MTAVTHGWPIDGRGQGGGPEHVPAQVGEGRLAFHADPASGHVTGA